MPPTVLPSELAGAPDRFHTAAASGFALLRLRGARQLVAQVLPNGALFALRHGSVLINQILPGPAEDGLFRLLVRWRAAAESRSAEGDTSGWAPLVGAGVTCAQRDATRAVWHVSPREFLQCETQLELHAQRAAWCWRIRLHNASPQPLLVDVLHAQDLGLADEAAVRNNEAYVSQYLDLQPLHDDQFGWAILARQNQPTGEGKHPWLIAGCAQGAEAFCTDGWQFFGADHRVTGEPAAVRAERLPSLRLQYEFALAGLQSRPLRLAPRADAELLFVVGFLDDHPAASSVEDLKLLRELTADFRSSERQRPRDERRVPASAAGIRPGESVFTSAPWLHGDGPSEADLRTWFPEPHRHVERSDDGRVLAFFCAENTHVVTRAKEAAIARPHGHILRSGEAAWNDDAQFGLTAFAAGIFSAQTYLGNPSIARLLPVVRNALALARGAGQRVFVRRAGVWRQLGIPSAFAMTPDEVSWIYRAGSDLWQARVWCSRALSAAFLELTVLNGDAREFLVTHSLALGANEFDHSGTLQLHGSEGWAACEPGTESLVRQHLPGICFAVATADTNATATLGGDELIYADHVRRGGPYLALRSEPTRNFGVIQLGGSEGTAALAPQLAAARAEFAKHQPIAAPPMLPLRLRHAMPALARLDEVLPWFNHNASIHFSAPHGLEQYGGAAWGVRDVCQGSIEWLLASGRYDIARRVLHAVFAQQYFGTDAATELTGTWPQWFMFPPFHFIQQAHSHGDVCFWPVKALCDYVEASNDLDILSTRIAYTDPKKFVSAGPEETLWAHCDRVIAHAESRFVPGTALVNYGDGDWDDTLQPADPAMRQRMISAWTVGLAFHTFRQLARVCRHANEPARAAQLDALCERMRADFAQHLMPDGIVAGFLVTDDSTLAKSRPLLHPRDRVTGIRYRLLPMTRSVLAELFIREEAVRHLEIVERELRHPDGVRLMSEPAAYHGGQEKLFKRAETAANVGREIGLQYVHAHLRYAEAMAKVGDAERLWWALQVVNPVGLSECVRNAAPRQSNVYFSSSDADFADRTEAAARWGELRTGRVAVRGGWRLYSSGPGLFLHKVRSCLLGLRETFDEIVFDPVLPRALDGLVAEAMLGDRRVEILYHVRSATSAPSAIRINGAAVPAAGRLENPYRTGGLRVRRNVLESLLREPVNRVEVEL